MASSIPCSRRNGNEDRVRGRTSRLVKCRQEKRGTCLAEEMEQGFVIPYRRKDKSYTTPVERAAGVINVVEQAAKSDETRRLRARGGIRLYETRAPFPRHMPRDAGMQISRRFPPPPFAIITTIDHTFIRRKRHHLGPN